MTVSIPETAQLRKKLRPHVLDHRPVELILDPRHVADEDVQRPRGVLIAVSAPTDQLVLWQSDADYVDTLRRRQRMEHEGVAGWWVTFDLTDVLDVELAS